MHVRVFLSRYRGYLTCPDCGGARLRREARDVHVSGRTIDRVSSLTVREAQTFFGSLQLSEKEQAIAEKVLKEIQRRLSFLSDVGLDYLTLDRLSSTLSGGEAQRINLATSLGSALVGTLYVLDEPSIGLHSRDNLRLIAILRQLRDQGNTVLVVEHDADMIKVADHIVDLGLGAGEQGGRVVFSGTLDGADARAALADVEVPAPGAGDPGADDAAARHRTEDQADRRDRAQPEERRPRDPAEHADRASPASADRASRRSCTTCSTPRSSARRAAGTSAVGTFDKLEGDRVRHRHGARRSGADRPDAAVEPGHLSQGVRSDPRAVRGDQGRARRAASPRATSRSTCPGGRCEACQGEGEVRVEMQFLADVFVPCDQCDGKRFKPQVLEVRYRGRSIHQVLDLTVREALTFFSSSPKVLRRLQVLDEIGLGYLRLGQPATTLSGGEAQRIKIAAHLSSHSGERLLYILDEPTTGLHFDDIAKLLTAFRKLLEAGHTLLVIEHNLDVIKTADYIIDLGPEGGEDGGTVVATGTPEQVAQVEASHTGRYLRPVLAEGRSHAYAADGEQVGAGWAG